jgi:predicted lipoprotein with Yx(FWY)xxD motif
MTLTRTTALSLLALSLSGTAAFADQHGNDFVHSRENNGQVYVMYQDHMSLYTFAEDTPGVSNCTGECAEIWMPATLDEGTKLGKSYGLIKRENGSWQATFRGLPLYLYSGDKRIGDINGDGIGGVWALARP